MKKDYSNQTLILRARRETRFDVGRGKAVQDTEIWNK